MDDLPLALVMDVDYALMLVGLAWLANAAFFARVAEGSKPGALH